ncbi:nitrile hydratase accessory protein [Rhodococcus qingshengii]|uniref:nitrile hydratase accessory protein n=1 Tax=Rhodococcus qingshengii TaxID=334542 RepID=UPI001C5DE5FD|nr:nitrile hydratase accessory protein [Rhodococcus qingshengii]MBW4818768.1 nitrile hydratase accessory protein [Rhodococcus qingshengii]
MSRETLTDKLPAEGESAPPRDNGELVFTEPWEATAFGLAVALSDQKSYDWDFFRERLVTKIDEANGCEAYYESWAKALEAAVIDSGLISESEVREEMAKLDIA